MTALDLGVRERLPDRAQRGLDVAVTAFAVVLNGVAFVLAAALGFGIATAEFSLADVTVLIAVIYGTPVLFYVIGRVRGDSEQMAGGAVAAIEFVVYSALGVGVAVVPSPGDAVLFYGGMVVAGLVAVEYEWVVARLGFETAGEEVAA